MNTTNPAEGGRYPYGLWGVRFLFGLLLGFLVRVSNLVADSSSSLMALDWESATNAAAIPLLGVPGFLGIATVEIGSGLLQGSPLTPLVLLTLAQTIPGTLALFLFMYVPRARPSLPNLRSFLVLAAAALVGGAATGIASSALVFRSVFFDAAFLWSAGVFVGILLFAPPLLLTGSKWLERWVIHFPDRNGNANDGFAARSMANEQESSIRRFGRPLLILGQIVAVTAVAVFVSGRVPEAGQWLNLLYVAPILWAAATHGLRGGLLASSGVGVCFLAVRSFTGLSSTPLETHQQILGTFPVLILFCFLGSLFGAARDTEIELNSSLAAKNRMLREDLERAVRGLTGALEAKDGYTEAHVGRVAELALTIGSHLGLDETELQAVQWASLLHDIGKIGIPEHVLNKPGPLTEAEKHLIMKHPEIGARILGNIAGMEGAAQLVLHHQERYDGQSDCKYPGYPMNLKRDEIPLGSRIIAVLDAFDAMTTDRPYRPRMDRDEALSEVRRERGRQFDPNVVDVFIEYMSRQSLPESKAHA